MKFISTIVVTFMLLISTSSAKTGDIYGGLQWFGLSAKYDVNNKVTAQGIVSVFGFSDLQYYQKNF